MTHADSYFALVLFPEPWRWPDTVKGCSASDLVNLELAAIPVVQCMKPDVAKLLQTYNGATATGQVEDATYQAAISCAYNPHNSNQDCNYLLSVASRKLEKSLIPGDDSMTARVIDNLDEICTCSKGISTSYPAKSISQNCAASDIVNFLAAGEELCNHLPALKEGAHTALAGCDDADIANIGLVAIQAYDCLHADGRAVLGSTKALSDARIKELTMCSQQTSYSNQKCMDLIAGLPSVIAGQQVSLEGLLAKEISAANNGAFCNCMDNVAKSSPAQAISPTCKVPTSVLAFLRENKDTCLSLAGKQVTTWASTIASAQATKKRY